MIKRCRWAQTELSSAYHDREWGVPLHDDRALFEFLILEGAQAGLSWETILQKRDNYRAAFDNFEPARVARYSESKKEKLLQNPGIVRNRLKVSSTITNAKAFLAVQEEFGSFATYVWEFVDGRPMTRRRDQPVPAQTKESQALSKDLLRRGFKFVGPTICYAFMQAVGMVQDHDPTCFRSREISKGAVQI